MTSNYSSPYGNPRTANFGRANYGQLSPYTDQPGRTSQDDEEDDPTKQQQPDTPSTLAQAIAPQSTQASQSSSSPLANNPNTGISGGLNKAVSTAPADGSLSMLAGGLNQAGGMLSGNHTVPSMGAFTDHLAGFDQAKFGKNDPKYNMASVFSNFDPSKGVTPDLINALNGLGIGNFSGNGDKIHVDNGAGEFNGVSDIDAIQGFHSGNPMWAYQPEGGGGATPGPLAQAIAPQADPVAQNLAKQLGIDTNNPLWQQILQQLLNSPSTPSASTVGFSNNYADPTTGQVRTAY